MGEGGIKNPEKLPTLFMDDPLNIQNTNAQKKIKLLKKK
jgi:hypothetical protein